MKDNNIIRSWMRFVLMLLGALAFTFLQPYEQAEAQVNCGSNPSKNSDYDKDGFSDYDECNGISFAGRGTFPGFVGCGDRASCLDPNSPDLFVILVKPKSGSLIPTTPFQFIISGLGIFTHQITSSNAASDRKVAKTSTQKAVMITEDLDASTTDVLGEANCGTPNDLDYAKVYTARIKKSVEEAGNCSGNMGSSWCRNSCDNAGCGQDFFYRYVKQTIAHEIGHMIKLRSVFDDRYGGYHYNPGDSNYVVMDQSVSYSGSGVYSIGTEFDQADKSGITKFQLK